MQSGLDVSMRFTKRPSVDTNGLLKNARTEWITALRRSTDLG